MIALSIAGAAAQDEQAHGQPERHGARHEPRVGRGERP